MLSCIISSHAFSLISADSHQEELSKAAAFAFENRQAINGKFAQLLANVCNRMLEIGVDVMKFRRFVVALFPPGDCIPQTPANFTEVFDAITYHGLWDSLHYSPLVQIVRHFCAGDPEMKAWIQNYKKDLRAYVVVQKLDIEFDNYTDQSQMDRVRYRYPAEEGLEICEHALQHLADVWEMFSDRYVLPDSPPTVLIDRLLEHLGCEVQGVAEEGREVCSMSMSSPINSSPFWSKVVLLGDFVIAHARLNN